MTLDDLKSQNVISNVSEKQQEGILTSPTMIVVGGYAIESRDNSYCCCHNLIRIHSHNHAAKIYTFSENIGKTCEKFAKWVFIYSYICSREDRYRTITGSQIRVQRNTCHIIYDSFMGKFVINSCKSISNFVPTTR